MVSSSPTKGWFCCPTCDQVVPSLVDATGPENAQKMSRISCCLKCPDHDPVWCCGVPGSVFREVVIEDDDGSVHYAHCNVYEPDWDKVSKPVPAVLWLHGAWTYIWPETVHNQVEPILQGNSVSREALIVAPIAGMNEPLAVLEDLADRSDTGVLKVDRYGNRARRVKGFHMKRTWQAFLNVCEHFGGRVDFTRLSGTGLSMGAQALWKLAEMGMPLAAIAPISGCWDWHWRSPMCFLQEMPIAAYYVAEDSSCVANGLNDFHWLAEKRYLREAQKPSRSEARILGQRCAETMYWDRNFKLTVIRGHDDCHNCWDLVWQHEETFEVFKWLTSLQNANGVNHRRRADEGREDEVAAEVDSAKSSSP